MLERHPERLSHGPAPNLPVDARDGRFIAEQAPDLGLRAVLWVSSWDNPTIAHSAVRGIAGRDGPRPSHRRAGPGR